MDSLPPDELPRTDPSTSRHSPLQPSGCLDAYNVLKCSRKDFPIGYDAYVMHIGSRSLMQLEVERRKLLPIATPAGPQGLSAGERESA